MSARNWFAVVGMSLSGLSAGAFITDRHALAFALLAVSFCMLQVLKRWKVKQ